MVEKKKSSSKQMKDRSGLRKPSRHGRQNESKKQSLLKKRSAVKSSHSKKSRAKSRKGLYLCFPFSFLDSFFPSKEESGYSLDSSKSAKSLKSTLSTKVNKKKSTQDQQNGKKVSVPVLNLQETKNTPVEHNITLDNCAKFTGLLGNLPFSSFLGSNMMSVEDIKNLLKKRPELQEQLKQILGDKLDMPAMKPIKDLLDELAEEGNKKTNNENPVKKSSLKKESSVVPGKKQLNIKKSVTISTTDNKKLIRDSPSRSSMKKLKSKSSKNDETKSLFRQIYNKIFFKGSESLRKSSSSSLNIRDCSFISKKANNELKARYKEWVNLSPKNQKRCTFEEYVKVIVYVDELKKNSSSESKKERRRIKAWLASLGQETADRSSQTDVPTSDVSRPSFFDSDDLMSGAITPSIASMCKPSFLSLTKNNSKDLINSINEGDGVMHRLKSLVHELAELKEMSKVKNQKERKNENSVEKQQENKLDKNTVNERPIMGGFDFNDKKRFAGDGPVPHPSVKSPLKGSQSPEDALAMNQVKELCFGLLNQISAQGRSPSTFPNGPSVSTDPVQLFHMQTELIQFEEPQSLTQKCLRRSQASISQSKSSLIEENSDPLLSLVQCRQSRSSTSWENMKCMVKPEGNELQTKLSGTKTVDKIVMDHVINLAKGKESIVYYADSGFNSNGSKYHEEPQEEVVSSDESVGEEAVILVSETGMSEEELLDGAESEGGMLEECVSEPVLVWKSVSDPTLSEGGVHDVECRWLDVELGPPPDAPRRCRSGLPPTTPAPPPGVRSAPHLLWPSSCDELSSLSSHISDSELSSRGSSISDARPASSPCLVSVSTTNLPICFDSCPKTSKSSKLKNLFGKLKK